MKKKIALILSAIMLITTLTACGEGDEQSTSSSQAKENVSADTADISGDNSQTEAEPQGTTAEEVPYSYNGAYTDGTNYLVFDNGVIMMNGQECEVTKIQTDHFKNKIPVVYFMYDGKEVSAYSKEGYMYCTLGQSDGSWNGFDAVNISEVPNFSDGSEEATTPTENAEAYDSSAYAGITFTEKFGDRSITIDEVDADGCPTAITSDGNKTVFERHDDMSKDDHGWIVRVYWSEMNGEQGDFACDIVYYSEDNHFEIRGYGFSGDYYLSDDIVLE